MAQELIREGLFITGLGLLSIILSVGIKTLGQWLPGTTSHGVALFIVLIPSLVLALILGWRSLQAKSEA